VISAVQLLLPAARALFEVPFIENEVVGNARAEAMKRSLDAIDDAKKTLSTVALPVSDSVSVLLDNPAEIILNEAPPGVPISSSLAPTAITARTSSCWAASPKP